VALNTRSQFIHSFFSLPSIALAFALLCAVSCERGPREGLLAGDKAPDLNLVDLQGNPARLSDQKGKLIILNFWASWCTPCLIEMPDLKRLYEHFKDRGLEIVAVAVEDDQQSIQKLVDKYELPFTVLIDKSGRTKSLYRLAGFPETFILDENQIIQLVTDPANDSLSTRIMGPREWSSEHVVRMIDLLLQ
jgi:peroxiredoxin